jgi:hypothetical protein
MPLFTLNFRKKILKVVEPPKVEEVPVYVSENKKDDVKPKLKNKIKVRNDSKIKLQKTSKKKEEIHLSEDEDT